MFINVSPLRININPEEKFLEFLNVISHSSREMLKHQKYSYNYILEDVRKMDPSTPSLYNIVLSYQITKANKVTDYNFETRWTFNGNCNENLEIQLYDLDETGELTLSYDYKINKYTKQDIKKINERLFYIINQVLEKDISKIQDLQIVLPEEKEEILKINRKVDFKLEKNIVEIFENHVLENPNHIAVIDESEEISYLELNNMANRIAHFLLKKNVKQNSIIAISSSRNKFLISSILAILKIGCSYLPIFPEYPEDRINYILRDSDASYLITDFDINTNFEYKTNIKSLNLENYSKENLNIKVNLENLAYVIYTSGSTGNPKGVMLKHSNLLNFLYSFNEQFNNKFYFNDICLSLTNISFDVSVCEIFVPLMFNSTLVLYPENTLTNIPLLCSILNKHKITFLYLPPSLITSTYQFTKENNIEIFINKMLVGVEAIQNKTLNNFYNLNENIEIINGYGPTETTICCTFFKHKKTSKDIENDIVPIGQPLLNNTMILLNKDLNIVPINTYGEIYLSGANVSLGYLNKKDLTNQNFIKINDKIFYKTGDIATLDSNGYIHFKGRNDSQIKFKGNRIELNEINLNIRKIERNFKFYNYY